MSITIKRNRKGVLTVGTKQKLVQHIYKQFKDLSSQFINTPRKTNEAENQQHPQILS